MFEHKLDEKLNPSICVVFLQVYGRIFRVVEPKRAQLNAAMSQLKEKQDALAAAQNKLREVGRCLDPNSHEFKFIHSASLLKEVKYACDETDIIVKYCVRV